MTTLAVSSRVQYEPLYRAQQAAYSVVRNPYFFVPPRAEIDTVKYWLEKKVLQVYNALYDAVSSLYSALVRLVEKVKGCVHRVLLAHCPQKAYPVNPISGKHHLVGISRKTEKFLGDWIYALHTRHEMKTHEPFLGTKEAMAGRVEALLQKLKAANQELLNPTGEEPFDYRALTVTSPSMNAFCVPAGGIVVFSRLIQEIEMAIQCKTISHSTIRFEDGSEIKVDLSNVTTNDVIAFLLSHEMTHAASRHGIVRLIENLLLSLFSPNLETLQHFLELTRSRAAEYEADVTGAYFTQHAGFNALGGLFLQEIFSQGQDEKASFLNKHFEFLVTHPCAEHRKRALFAALQDLGVVGRIGNEAQNSV